MSAPARHHRPASLVIRSATALLICFALSLPGTSQGQVLINEGFDAWPVKPAGWTFSGIADGDIYTTAGDYGAASPSLKLDAGGDYITTAPLTAPAQLQFWVKGQGTDITSSLLVEEYYAPAWATVTDIFSLPVVGTVFGGLALNPSSTQARFTFNQSVGDLGFDDVLIMGLAPTQTPTPAPTPTPTPEGFKTPVPTPTPEIVVDCEGFDDYVAFDWIVPAGWTFTGITGNYTAAGDYGTASPSVRLDTNNAQIVTKELAHPEALTFWIKGQGNDGSCRLLVEEYYGGWTNVTSVYAYPPQWPAGAVLGPFALDSQSTRARFTFQKDQMNLAFDDVCFTLLAPTPTPPPSPTISPTPQGYKTPPPTPFMECEGFDDFLDPSWVVPVNWQFFGIGAGDNYTESGYYGVASPALKFSSNYEGVTRDKLVRPVELTFWVRGQGTEVSSALFVQEYYAGSFTTVTTVRNFPTDAGAVLGPFPLEFSSTQLNFLYLRDAGDLELAFDDVCILFADASPTPVGYKTPVPTPTPITACEGFDNFQLGVRPSGWTFITIDSDDTYLDAGNYGVAAPSLRLEWTDQEIITGPTYRPESLTFWAKGQAGIGTCTLFIEEYYNPAGWSPVTTVAFSSSIAGSVIGPIPLDFPTTNVSFKYQWNGISLAFDDVCFYQADPTPSVPPTPVPPSPTPTMPPAGPPGPIKGRVYDRVTGVGIGNVYVSAFPMLEGLQAYGDMTNSGGYYTLNEHNPNLPSGLYILYCYAVESMGVRRYRDQYYNQKDDKALANYVPTNSSGIDFPLYRVGEYPTPAPPTPVPTVTPFYLPIRVASGDYNGDGVSDIAIFRPASGLWAVRGFTRAYFGQADDIPVSGDYSGDGSADIAVFRSATGLWVVRGFTRAYFGNGTDIPVPGDYDGDGFVDIAIFRNDRGLWAIKDVDRSYFGGPGDTPVHGDYTGDGFADVAVFRPSTGLWAVQDVTRVYFGFAGDSPVPGDYQGLGMVSPALFRPSSGLWAVRGWTRTYFGNAAYQAVPAGYSGGGSDRIGVFWPAYGLWAVRDLTRLHFGRDYDLPATR